MPLRQVTIGATAETASLAPLRHLLCAVATALDCTVEPAVLQLLASEVLANAVDHSHGDVSVVSTRLVGGALRVEIVNVGTGWPALRHPAPLDEHGGRGLLIVDALAEAWGASTGEGSVTSVWFVLAPCPAPPDAPPAALAGPAATPTRPA